MSLQVDHPDCKWAPHVAMQVGFGRCFPLLLQPFQEGAWAQQLAMQVEWRDDFYCYYSCFREGAGASQVAMQAV